MSEVQVTSRTDTTRQAMHVQTPTLRRVRETTVAVEKLKVLHILSVCL